MIMYSIILIYHYKMFIIIGKTVLYLYICHTHLWYNRNARDVPCKKQ